MATPADSQSPILYACFQQNSSELVVIHQDWCHVFEVQAPGAVKQSVGLEWPHVAMATKMPGEDTMALVTSTNRRKVQLIDSGTAQVLDSFVFPQEVTCLKLSACQLVVALSEGLYVYQVRGAKSKLHQCLGKTGHPYGLLAMCSTDSLALVALPGLDPGGHVSLFDLQQRPSEGFSTHGVHDESLEALVFNQDGKRLATASQLGTVIRVWAIPSFQKLYEFRRGVRNLTTVHCLTFSPCGALLAAVSDRSTVHVFKMADQAEEGEKEGWGCRTLSVIRSWCASVVTMVTTAVCAQNLTLGRAFAWAKVPDQDPVGRRSCTFLGLDGKLHLHVLLSSRLRTYEVATDAGGEMTLIGQVSIAAPGMFDLHPEATDDDFRHGVHWRLGIPVTWS